MYNNRLLSHKRSSQISKSLAEDTFYLQHHNLMLYFTAERFKEFNYLLHQYKFEDNSFLFPDGEERIIIQSPERDIRFVFTEEEFEDLKFAVEEAMLMDQIYSFL